MSLRPGGVTGIAILFLAVGIGALIFGILCLTMADFVKNLYDTNFGPLFQGIPQIGDNLLDVDINTVYIAGAILVPFGAADLLTGVGLLKLKKWGYWLAIIIASPFILAIIGLVIIWYLRKDEVKAAFDIT